MPNYAQAAISIRQKKEKEARAKEQEKRWEYVGTSSAHVPQYNENLYQSHVQIPVGPNGIRPANAQAKKKEEGARHQPHANIEGGGGGANVILYIGLGMVAMGLVITFVGLGDKGFRTLELKLIGPSLVGCGMFFALLRILFCTLPSCCRSCFKCCRNTEEAEKLIKKEEERVKTAVSVKREGSRTARIVRTPRTNGTAMNSFDRRNIEIRPKPSPHFVSDSEEEDMGRKVSMRQQRTHSETNYVSRPEKRKEADSVSATSSSTFSVNDVGAGGLPMISNLGGSTKNLRSGEIILNATKLKIETDKD